MGSELGAQGRPASELCTGLRGSMTTSALALSCLLALAAWGMEVRAATHHHPTDNKHEDAIEEFQEILQNQVRNDFLELEEKFNDLVEDINLTLESLQTYTNESIEELRKHTLDNMVERDQHLDNNMVSFESYITDKIEELNSTMKENFDKLNELSEGERHTIVGWIHQRTHSHEDILKSEIGLCAYDNGHEGVGVVTYNSGTDSAGYVGGTKKWRVFNTTHPDLCCKGPGQGDDCEDCAMKVLNRQTGYFTVPQNAAGLYMFTFSVTMDTFDDYELLPKEYKFEKNGHLLDDGLMGIYADAGSNRANDKVPGSRTILLRLEDGDQVAVRQTRADGLDGQILFCGALLHLKKSSESPGGGASEPPPVGDWRDLGMAQVGYNFGGFQDIPAVSTFEYSTRDTGEGSLLVSTDRRVGELAADSCHNYRGKIYRQNRKETCKTIKGLIDF